MSRNQWIALAVLVIAVVIVLVVCACLGGFLLLVLVSGPGTPPITTHEPVATQEPPTIEATPPIASTPTDTPTSTPTLTHTPTQTASPTATHTRSPTATHIPTSTLTPTSLPPAATATPAMTEARVTSVIDGDTIEVALAGQTYRVRYIGIECAEPGLYGSEQATQENRHLVEGKTVRLEKDVSETDQYGRLLRYVYVGGIFVNAELIRRGVATAWTYPPDVAYSDLFVQLEREAREDGRGLWAAPTPTMGSTWNCSGNLYNCSAFSSCAQVMSYWSACPGDPSRLDGDHDGRPCESLCR